MKAHFFSLTILISVVGIYASTATGLNTAEAYIQQEQCYLKAILPDKPNEQTKYDCTTDGNKDQPCDSTEGKCG